MEQHYLRPLFDPALIRVYAPASGSAIDTAAGGYADGLKAALAEGAFAGKAGGKVSYWLRADDGSFHATPEVSADDARNNPTGVPDLALITLGAEAAIGALAHAAAGGTQAAIIYDAHMNVDITQRLKACAKTQSVHLLGPASLGMQRPHLGLNACLAGKLPRAGKLAMVSQSGALTAAMLDWAESNGVSFSLVASLGRDSALYFADVLDFLASDGRTQSIVLYLESIPENGARRFMSALRAAARNKPVIVLKAGRHDAGKRAAITHSGAMVGGDDVFDAALRRAGAVRVGSFVELFAAAKCLTSRQKPVGNRLAIITNGGGPAVLAADHAAAIGVELAALSTESIDQLRARLPDWNASAGPLDLGEDAGAGEYLAAVEIVAADENVDGLLIIVTPKPGLAVAAIAEAAIRRLPTLGKPAIACWMGEPRIAGLRRAIIESGLPVFRLPEAAVDAFASVALFYRNQQASMQTPPPLMSTGAEGTEDGESGRGDAGAPDIAAARALINAVLAQGRELLTETESKALLAAFRIPVAPTTVADTEEAAVAVATRIGYPVVLKISSPDVVHKTDVGGVLLNVRSADQVRAGFRVLCDEVRQRMPGAHIDGVAIQPMVVKRNGREWYVGMTTDALFGPVITLGAGGVMVELFNDRTVALPPLNQFLAQRVIERSPLVAQLGAWRGMPPVKMAALEYLLMRVSEMICELPALRELDINPVIIDEHGVAVVDASAVVRLPAAHGGRRYSHMAILPYPSYLTMPLTLKTGEVITLRAIRPEDADALQSFVRKLSAEARYFRFISTMAELPLPMLARFTQIDYFREMAIVAIAHTHTHANAPAQRLVGVARYMLLPDAESCEYGLAVADDYQRCGLGSALMNRLADIAREQGLKTMVGMVLNHNNGMLRLMTRLGFSIDADPEDADMRRVVRSL